MVSPGLKAVELAIHHMRNGSQRMPVGGMNVGKSPLDPTQGDTVGNPWIFVKVVVVVVVNELIPDSLAKTIQTIAASSTQQTLVTARSLKV